jgi:signal transduction histidine kinase
MNFSNLIGRHFNRVLLISVIACGITIAVFSYFSAMTEYKKAKEFIFGHVMAIAESEINIQNTSEIDKKVNLLFLTWAKTQDLNLRIRVYLDNTLIAHAGDLQPFLWLSKTIVQNKALPSNQNLTVQLQISFFNTLIISIVSFLIILVFLVSLFQILKRNITRSLKQMTSPLEERVTWLSLASHNLETSIKRGYEIKPTDIFEMKNLDQSLGLLFDRFLSYEKNLAEKSFDEGRIRTVNTVAHNLKNIIAVFDHRVRSATSIDEAEREKFQDILIQFQDLSSGVLKQHKKEQQEKSGFVQFEIGKSVQKMAEQMKESLGKDSKVQIEILVTKSSLVKTSYGPRVEFESTIANLISNSIEAIKDKGLITVALDIKQAYVEIIITDTGCGIPADILPRLAVEGNTFKPNGNGYDLFHAKNTIENQMGGVFSISSTEGVGTSVSLKLPVVLEKKSTPSLTVPILPGMSIVIIDDEPLIHESYRRIILEKSPGTKIVSIYSGQEFEKWFQENEDLTFKFYLFDFNLGETSKDGLQLIEQYSLGLESLLITGDAHLPEIQQKAKQLCTRVVSKDDIKNINFDVLKEFNSTGISVPV